MRDFPKLKPALVALGSALLFGASTPAAKVLVGRIDPILLAGILYLGSGLGLSVFSLFKCNTSTEATLQKKDIIWLTGAVLFGGVLAPLLLMNGLQNTPAASASLLLNTEAVFTSVLAWFVFKENFDKRIVLGMFAIVLGSVALTMHPGAQLTFAAGATAILAACFFWGLDNNLTRKISYADAVQIASIKGIVAGVVNCTIAQIQHAETPEPVTVVTAAMIGFLGYGISLVLFIQALRSLGAARAGAYFSTAPFSGAIIAVFFLHESMSANLLIAGAFMACGVWLHLTEVHEHEHSHAAEEHTHLHSHDEHHQHNHNLDDPISEPHSHGHQHEMITHSHSHFPDAWHQHEHN